AVREAGPGRLGRAVRRAVVNDQDRDLGEAGKAPGERGQGVRKRRLLVPGRYLDDELHRETPARLPIVTSIYEFAARTVCRRRRISRFSCKLRTRSGREPMGF